MNASALTHPRHQRSRGRLDLDYALHEGRTMLGGLYQSPPMRALFPDPEADEAPICALVNTAGGLAGGDRVEIALSLGAGARASFSTPAAEKIYRSLGPATEISVSLEAGPGAVFEWIPQETILFEGARLQRSMRADIAEDATLLMAEALVFGRAPARWPRLICAMLCVMMARLPAWCGPACCWRAGWAVRLRCGKG
ncbi:MAG: hypothetical protein EBU14_06210 [Acetobacteraceae bacterium]|nr:hypothetical protein [Acetobacteraceae bacterium]